MASNRERHGAAVVSAGTPQSNKVGLQARGLFRRAVYMLSRGVSASVDGCLSPLWPPRYTGDLSWVLPRRLELDISDSANLRAAEAVLQNRQTEVHVTVQRKRMKLGSMDGNHGSSREISKKHPAVCRIRMTNISHGLGCARNILSLHL